MNEKVRVKRKKKVHISNKRLRQKQRLKWFLGIFITLITIAPVILWQFGLLPFFQSSNNFYDIKAENKVLVSLPMDEASHQNETEWWYYNGHLTTTQNKKYSFHYSIFLLNSMAKHTIIHASLMDQESGQHYQFQKHFPGTAFKPQTNGFLFSDNGWLMSIKNGNDYLKSSAPDFMFDLTLKSRKPVSYHDENGLLDFKEIGKSYYYSRSRMDIKGMAGPKGEEKIVSGQAWFDHQWGDFRTTSLGWNWFALQLDNGADIMLYDIFDSNGQNILTTGSYILNGETTNLTSQDFKITPLKIWTDPISKRTYPVKWKIQIPSRQVLITLDAHVENSLFDGTKTIYNKYWEGSAQISGSNTGIGFVEMSDYSSN